MIRFMFTVFGLNGFSQFDDHVASDFPKAISLEWQFPDTPEFASLCYTLIQRLNNVERYHHS